MGRVILIIEDACDTSEVDGLLIAMKREHDGPSTPADMAANMCLNTLAIIGKIQPIPMPDGDERIEFYKDEED